MKKFTPFRILSRSWESQNPWIPLEKQEVELPGGAVTDWYVVRGANVVIVVPMLSDGRVLVQRVYKHGAATTLAEFCAGVIDPRESPLEAAKRELLEESGYAAADWQELGSFFANPTSSETRYTVFLARDCEQIQEPDLEEAEQIENIILPSLDDVLPFFQQERTSMAALAALALAQEKKGK